MLIKGPAKFRAFVRLAGTATAIHWIWQGAPVLNISSERRVSKARDASVAFVRISRTLWDIIWQS